jgi:hypothetical protein
MTVPVCEGLPIEHEEDRLSGADAPLHSSTECNSNSAAATMMSSEPIGWRLAFA